MLLLGAVRVVPAGTFQESPPLTKVAQINGLARRCEHQRTSKQHMRKRARIIFWIGRNLRKCHMMSRVNEFLELPICHGMGIDPEVTDGDAMNRRFFRIMLVGSHAEPPGIGSCLRYWNCHA